MYCGGGVVVLTDILSRHGRHQAILCRILVNASVVQSVGIALTAEYMGQTSTKCISGNK